MSAEKPEAGDVWENDGLILHIDKFSEDKYGKIIYCYDMDKKGYVAGCWYYLDIFLNNAKYLGKSKASIKDLFEVESNEEYITLAQALEKEALEEKIEFAKEAVDLFFKTEDESKLLEIAEWK